MELYGRIVINEAGRVADADVPLRMAFTAAELLFASALALNAIKPGSAVADLAHERSYPVRTPFSHAFAAIEGILTAIAHADGLNDTDARTVVERAMDAQHDMIGESDPVRRAYGYARADLIDEAHGEAFDAELDHCGH